MIYGLKLKGNNTIKVTCICGKHPEITIDESVKEDFKELMHWTEKEFIQNTFIVEEKK